MKPNKGCFYKKGDRVVCKYKRKSSRKEKWGLTPTFFFENQFLRIGQKYEILFSRYIQNKEFVYIAEDYMIGGKMPHPVNNYYPADWFEPVTPCLIRKKKLSILKNSNETIE